MWQEGRLPATREAGGADGDHSGTDHEDLTSCARELGLSSVGVGNH